MMRAIPTILPDAELILITSPQSNIIPYRLYLPYILIWNSFHKMYNINYTIYVILFCKQTRWLSFLHSDLEHDQLGTRNIPALHLYGVKRFSGPMAMMCVMFMSNVNHSESKSMRFQGRDVSIFLGCLIGLVLYLHFLRRCAWVKIMLLLESNNECLRSSR